MPAVSVSRQAFESSDAAYAFVEVLRSRGLRRSTQTGRLTPGCYQLEQGDEVVAWVELDGFRHEEDGPAAAPPRELAPRSTEGLREMLFQELEDLRGGTGDPARAQAVCKLADKILQSAKIDLEAAKFIDGMGSPARGLLSAWGQNGDDE